LACCDKEFHTLEELVEHLKTKRTRKSKKVME